MKKILILLTFSFVFFGCSTKTVEKVTVKECDRSNEKAMQEHLEKRESLVQELTKECTQKIDANTRAIEKLSIKHKKTVHKPKVKKKKAVLKKVKKPKKVAKPKQVVIQVGDKVCRHSKGLSGFIPINLVAKVQKKNNGLIKVKVIDSYGENGQYVGLRLYSNMIVNDKQKNWKHCK